MKAAILVYVFAGFVVASIFQTEAEERCFDQVFWRGTSAVVLWPVASVALVFDLLTDVCEAKP